MALFVALNNGAIRGEEFFAGDILDDVQQPRQVAELPDAGVQLVALPEPTLETAAAIAQDQRTKGAPKERLAEIMIAAAAVALGGGGGFPGYGGVPPGITDAAGSAGVALTVSRSDHTHAHGSRGGGTLHAAATGATAGFMSAADKAKLDAYPATPAGIDHNTLTNLTTGDVHTQYVFGAGRAGGQTVNGGTAASEELILRGTTNANLGLVRLQAPIDFDDVTPANALNPHSIRDASTATIAAPFIGGTFNDSRTIDFSNSVFVYETLRGAPVITSGVAPTFAAFTLFQALPVLRGGSSTAFGPLQALILNAGPNIQAGSVAGTFTCPTATAVNFSPVLNPLASGRTIAVTTINGIVCAPRWNVPAGSTANFGTIRGLSAQNPAVALFGSSAGARVMTAYYAVDVDAIALGAAPVMALRSAVTNGVTANRFLQNNGGASSDFGAGIVHLNANAPIQFGGGVSTQNASLFWSTGATALSFFFAANSNQWFLSNPASNRYLFEGNNGIGSNSTQFNFACSKFSIGAQTTAVGNQVAAFVAGAQTVPVAGEWSDFLMTTSANLDLNGLAMSTIAAWTLNARSLTLSGGSAVTNCVLRVQGNPGSAATNRVGLMILSNPTGGAGVNAALWVTAGRSRFDAIVDINNGVALGGGAGATLGTIGGAGPTAAAQSQWLRIDIGGTAHWIPVWV